MCFALSKIRENCLLLPLVESTMFPGVIASDSSIGSKSLNQRKTASVNSMTYFFKLNDLKETLATTFL